MTDPGPTEDRRDAGNPADRPVSPETALRDILHVIARSRDDELPVFEAILRNAAQLCHAPAARLDIANAARTHVRVACAYGALPRQTAVGDEHPLDLPHIVPTTVREGRRFHVPDLADTELYRAGDRFRKMLVDADGWRTYLTVPLMRDGEGIGCIILSRREVKPFEESEIALVEAFAEQAVIAIENVRQFKALTALNAELEDRVAEQVAEIERIGRLRRFLSPQVADAVVSSGEETLLSSHRALICVLFCDMRGFTAFCETAEPEETIEVLQTYHDEMGQLLRHHGVGVDHRSGDGIMAVFNDPLPCEDPAGDAVQLAVAMRARMRELCAGWRKLGHRLGFGVGISLGYATVGIVGAVDRQQYTASGSAVNLGARLCDHAADGEILLSRRTATAIEDQFDVRAIGEISFKGIRGPVDVFRLDAS